MTRANFRLIVDAIVATQGRPYVSTSAEINRVVNYRLRDLSERTRCIYKDNTALTLQTTTNLYDLRGAQLDQDVIEPEILFIDGVALTDNRGGYGPWPLEDFYRNYPNAQNLTLVDSARPTAWTIVPPQSIRFNCKPDQVYSSCWVVGPVLHPEIDTGAGGDSIALSIPEEMESTAAYWCAVGLLGPKQGGVEEMSRLKELSPEAWDQITRMSSRTIKDKGPRIRGTRSDAGVLSLS